MMRLLGGAAVVGAVVWLSTPTVNQSHRPPTLESAVGRPGTAEEFRWESPFQAARYRVTVQSPAGMVIFTGESSGPPYRPDALRRSQLIAGETYTWKVESLDASGEVIAQSVPASFIYRP